MIGKLTGTLADKNPPQVLVDCHGVGYEVDVPMSTFYNLPALGEKVSLRTHLMMCTGCSEYRRQLKTLRQVMQAYAEGKAIADDAAPGQGNG